MTETQKQQRPLPYEWDVGRIVCSVTACVFGKNVKINIKQVSMKITVFFFMNTTPFNFYIVLFQILPLALLLLR